MKTIRWTVCTALSAALALASGLQAQDAPHHRQAREIFAQVISFRSAAGHKQVPPLVQYMTATLRADPRTAGIEIVFAKDADAVVAASRPGALIGWSFYSPEAHEIEAALREVRARAPGALHIAGGVHATAEPLDTLRRGFDLVALGEVALELGAYFLEARCHPTAGASVARFGGVEFRHSARSLVADEDCLAAWSVSSIRTGYGTSSV